MSVTTSYHPPADARELLAAWARRTRTSKVSHYAMAHRLGRRAQWLGLPVMLITVLVGTSAFASIASQAVSIEAKLAVGLLSVLATVLSSLQTFFKYPERAEQHRRSAAKYGAIERELEVLFAAGGAAVDPVQVAALRAKLDRLAEDAPHGTWQVFVEDAKVGRTTEHAGGEIVKSVA
jgi:hypothetical protein